MNSNFFPNLFPPSAFDPDDLNNIGSSNSSNSSSNNNGGVLTQPGSNSSNSSSNNNGMVYDPTYDVWIKAGGSDSSSHSENDYISSRYEDSTKFDNVNIPQWLDIVEDFLNKQYEFNQASADKAMKYELEHIKDERAYNEKWLQDYYSNVMKSLKKAGINPLLAIQNIGGVNMPSPSSFTGRVATGSYGSPTSILSSAISGLNGNKQLVGNMLSKLVSILVGLLI